MMTDPPLTVVQRWMQDALISPEAAEGADQIIAESTRLLPSDALAIYQRGYYARLFTCMREQFPALAHALGKPLFTDFALDYLRACPSKSYTLADLGERFASYLQESRPDHDDARETWIDFVVDLATFERQLFVLFDAPGHEGEPFARVDTPDEHLSLQPCFALGTYRFDVGTYYHHVQRGSAPQLPDQFPWAAAMVRREYVTHTHPVTHAQAVFLQTLAAGRSVPAALSEVAANTAVAFGEVQRSWRDPAGVRARWISAGFFVVAAAK